MYIYLLHKLHIFTNIYIHKYKTYIYIYIYILHHPSTASTTASATSFSTVTSISFSPDTSTGLDAMAEVMTQSGAGATVWSARQTSSSGVKLLPPQLRFFLRRQASPSFMVKLLPPPSPSSDGDAFLHLGLLLRLCASSPSSYCSNPWNRFFKSSRFIR